MKHQILPPRTRPSRTGVWSPPRTAAYSPGQGSGLRNAYSVNFDGTDEFMSTGGADTNLADKTYTFWAKSSATSTGAKGTIFSHGGPNKGAFHFNWSSSRPLLYLGTSYYRFWQDVASGAQDDGAWHFWTVVVDVSDVTGSLLYVDAVLQTADTDATTSANVQAYEGIQLGRSASGDNHFTGNIDEFCVFDGHLTAAEILTLWNNGVPKSPTSLSPEHWWRMGDSNASSDGFIYDEVDKTLGSELITGFTNGTSYPLDTLITSGRDITSAIETSGNWGGCASNVISIVAGEVYEVTFDLTYNSGTDTLNVLLTYGSDGKAGGRSTYLRTNTDGTNTAQLSVTETDSTAYLTFQTWHATDVINFAATNVSLKKVGGGGKPGILQSGAVIQTDAP